MDQRVSLITLGVRDLPCAVAFYEALGWTRAEAPEGIVVFDLLGQSLALYPVEELARDIGLPVAQLGTGAATLACNQRDRAGVDAVMAAAQAAGGEVLRAAGEVFWGGYIGYFADPDGHLWEVAFNPFAPLSGEGAFRWAGY